MTEIPPKRIASRLIALSLAVLFVAVLSLAAMVTAIEAAGPARAAAREDSNKAVVLDFYEQALNRHDFEAAAKHFGPRYIQHNPRAADGIEGFRAFIQARKERTPRARSEVKRAFAEGDFVVLHVHSVPEPGERGAAIVDIFRLENGKIVEHWDVIQPVPETAANPNGLF